MILRQISIILVQCIIRFHAYHAKMQETDIELTWRLKSTPTFYFVCVENLSMFWILDLPLTYSRLH